MSIASVVQKDVLDVRRAKIVWFVGGLYSLIVALFFYQTSTVQGNPTTIDALFQLIFVGGIFIPAVSLVVAYLAIAGERESGSIKFLLSTPISRRQLILGKFVSRASIVTASVVLAFVVAAVLSSVLYGSVDLDAIAIIGGLTVLYALAYMSVALAVSAVTASRSRAMGGVLAFFFVTTIGVLMGDLSIQGTLDYVVNELLGLGVGSDPIALVTMLISPTVAYAGTTPFGLPDDRANFFGSDAAWYVGPEVALVVLLGWIVVPVALATWRFESADLS